MKVILLALLAALFCTTTALFAGRSQKYGMLPPPEGLNLLGSPDITPKWFQNRVDHYDNTNMDTYSQRYFVNGQFNDPKNPQAPVMLFIGAEGVMSPKWLTQGLMFEYAKRTGALMFALEHRYYGESQPRPDWSAKNLVYLSSSQALADVANFIKSQNMPSRPWVVFGGSYGGTLSAWARLKYPHLIHASIAASAPLIPQIDFSDFLTVAESALQWYGGNACRDNMNAVMKTINDMLNTSAGAKQLAKTLNFCTMPSPRPLLSEQDSQSLFQTMFDFFVQITQYNKENSGQLTTADVCSRLASAETPLAGYAQSFLEQMEKQHMGCFKWDFQTGMVDVLSNTTIDVNDGSRQWFMQTCKEFGFYQTSRTVKIFGEFELPLFDAMCRGAYGDQFNIDSLTFNAKRTNATYGATNYRQTNTLFTNGNIDPWHALSITEDIQRPVPVKTWFTPGTSHCAILYPDMPYDRPELTTAREEVFQELMKILKQFY